MNNLKRYSLRSATLTSLFGVCLMTGGLAVAERDTADTAMGRGVPTVPSEKPKPFTANRDMISLPEKQEALYSQLDSNRDGDIDREEAQSNPQLAKQYDELANETTGLITRSEFSRFHSDQP